jgi:glycosyltransferase involved in cell wall biosynthesis
MKDLSVVIITKNEEKNIERCLKSVIDIADDIVVVDSFSTDKTQEICEKYKVNFVQNEWMGYSNQKNFANSLAKFNWILSIDADEVISDKLSDSIREIKDKDFKDGFYSVRRLNNYCGKWIKHGSWYPDIKVRIFNREVSQWEGEIHEKLFIPMHFKPKKLNGHLLHFSFYTISEHLNQINKFTELSAIRYYESGKKPNLFNTILNSKLKFIRDYFFKLGFLDGKMGFVVCYFNAHSSFVKYIKLIQLHKSNKAK